MIIKERRYTIRHYLFGALPARLGDEMSGQAILLMGIAAHTVTLGSTLLAGLTLAAALGGPMLGATLDRSRQPGRVLALAIGLYALGIALIALTLSRIPTGLSVALAVGVGVFMPAISGGWSSRLKSFVVDEHMTRASAIDATTFNIAGLAGPALAGLIAAWAGAHWAAAVLVAFLAAALPMAWALPTHAHHASHELSFMQTVRSGFHTIFTKPSLLRITALSVVSYMGIGMLWVICPLVGQEIFGNAGYGGILMSVLSVGALAATLAYAKWPSRYSPDTVAFATTIMLGLAMLLLALAGNAPLAAIAMLLAGMADGPQLAAIFAVRHREATDHVRSQVFTTGASLKVTAAAFGAAFAGYLASSSLFWTILAACVVQLAAALVFIMVDRKQSTKS